MKKLLKKLFPGTIREFELKAIAEENFTSRVKIYVNGMLYNSYSWDEIYMNNGRIYITKYEKNVCFSCNRCFENNVDLYEHVRLCHPLK
jgi:hypothetical protein